MTLSNAVSTAINEDVLARFADRDPVTRQLTTIPDEKLGEAYRYAEAQQLAAQAIEQAVETLRANRFRVGLTVAALIQLHPVEIDELLLRFAQAIADKDPSRIDGRFSEREQALADIFRG